MKQYREWFDGLNKVVKIIFSVLGIFLFLYRLFLVIEEKAKNTERLVYLILNVVPIVGFVIMVLDIVAAAMDKPVPLSFGDAFGSDSQEDAPAEEKPEEAKPEESKPEEPAE